MVVCPPTSHPSWVRELKLSRIVYDRAQSSSHPSWVRELKHAGCGADRGQLPSHPSWVRELKRTERHPSHAM